ncbi:hypothetical protein V3C99_008916 [Haemonchus contortus]
MHPPRAFNSPLLWFLFFFQARAALFCTFTLTTAENVSWSHMNLSTSVYAQRHGGCLKTCFNEYPGCVMVGVLDVQVEGYKCACNICTLTNASLTDNALPLATSLTIYKLDRDKVDAKCPLAVDVLP